MTDEEKFLCRCACRRCTKQDEEECKTCEYNYYDKEVKRMSEPFYCNIAKAYCYEERPHGEWEALGFQNGYAFCRCSNCHKTMKLYLDSKNEFCCIADIRKKVVSCMYCGADMRKEGEAE